MKKIFIAVMAVAALASCAKEETVNIDRGDAIAFGDAFVENATRAIYETANDITGFTVFGNVNNVALYGNGATVTRNDKALGTAWDCSVARYWTPNGTFNFAAIANGTAAELANGLPTKIGYTVVDADPADLIYATATAATDANSVPTSGVNANKVVAFTFEHLLSRVKVSFENQIPETIYTYNITDVKITTWDKGTYTIGAATPWAKDGTGTIALNYTAVNALSNTATEEAGAKLVIPGSTIDLSFNYELCYNGTPIYETTTPVTKTAVVVPAQNHSYNITVQLKAGEPIRFTVDETNGLTDWEDETPVTIN